MTNPLLEVNNLNVEFDGEKILKDITFSVKEGEIIIIVGPNGAGKTTLFRAILGLIPHKGTVQWHTKDISYLPPHENLQAKNIPPLTIKDFFACKKSINIHDLPEALKLVGLKPTMQQKQFSELSTGQFQRMLIAWALIGNPRAILFDDPATAIDIQGQAELYELLKSHWKKQKMTMILITHNINMVWEHATRVICLNKTILCQGKPKETLTHENLYNIYGWSVKPYEHNHD